MNRTKKIIHGFEFHELSFLAENKKGQIKAILKDHVDTVAAYLF